MQIQKPKSAKEKELLSQLLLLDKEIRKRESVGHPGNYGMPDLLFPQGFQQGQYAEGVDIDVVNKLAGKDLHDGWVREPLDYEETDEQYRERQNVALNRFITENLFITKDGRKIYVRTIPQQLEFIADIFFKRTSKAILWKPRGGGGSLSAAVLIWIILVYKKISVLDLAGSGDQARIVYDYVKEFWECFPGLRAGLIEGDPLSQITRLVTGAEVKCIVPGTLIITNRGFVPIEEIRVGDLVLDGNGVFSPVKNVITRQHDGEIKKVTPVGALAFSVTPEHLLYGCVRDQRSRNIQRAKGWKYWAETELDPGWVEAKDLSEKDVLCMPRFFPKTRRNKKMLLKGKLGSNGASAWHDVDVPQSEEFYRFMGYWLSDGTTNGRQVEVIFEETQKIYIEDTAQLVSDIFNHTASFQKEDKKIRVRFTHKALAEWLKKECGCKENKRLPWSLFIESSLGDLKNLMAGLLKGDGCGTQSEGDLCKDGKPSIKREVSFTSISPHLAQIVFLSAHSLGMTASVHRYHIKESVIKGKRYDKKPHYQVRFGGHSCEVAAGILEKEFEGEKRRTGQHGAVTESYLCRPIRSIKSEMYNGTVYDLTVEGHPSFSVPYGLAHNCVPSTEKQARGKHYSVIVVDESCQEDPRPEKAMRAAIQGAMSEYDPIIVMLSTFHVPHGMFQEYWDDYENKGFTRYSWNCFDTMEPCTKGLETATEEDPNALEYCKNCFLTEKKVVKDASGQFEIETYTGCNGQARKAKGWAPFDSICETKKLNLGTTIFECEFACERPQYASSVYPPELIDASLTDPLTINPETDKIAVGIDWGIQTAGSLAINMIARMVEFVYVAEIIYSDHKLVSDVSELLNGWREQFGQFPVLADASHPFNNAELSEAGFDIRPISFGSWKKIGIENVSKFFVFHRLKINKSLTTLIEQLKKFRRNETTGNIVKKEDHGPDSLMVSLLNFRFEDEFGPDIAEASVLKEQKNLLKKKENPEERKDKVSFSDEGIAQTQTAVPDFVPQEAIIKKNKEKNVLVF